MRADQSRMARRRGSGWLAQRRQRGSIAIMAAIWLSVAVIVLSGIDIGRFYSERRHMQAAADLAALSSVMKASADSTCTAAKTAAQQVANPTANAVPSNATLSVTCGVWTAPQSSSGSALFTPTAGDPTAGQCGGLQAGTANGQSANAVCVTVSEPVIGFFRSGTTISASAIAKSTPTDTFTLSSSLASLNGGLANQLLQLLTGSPNALTLNAVDYQGLAQVNLKLAGILANLPVGSSTSVLNGTVTLGQLANAMIQAATQQNVASVKLNVLNAITAGLCSAGACGGPTIALNQLVSVATATGSSAVDASVNAFGLLSTALQVANGTNALSIPSIMVQTPTALAPLLNATVTGSVALTGMPPSTASGPPGPSNCGTSDCVTNTSTAQGNVFLNMSISLLSTCSNGSLVFPGGTCPSGKATPLAAVQLPVTAYVAPATAGLASVTCSANGTKSATVNVQTGLLAVYLGGSANTPINLKAPSGYTASGSATPITLVSVNLQSLLNLLNLGGLISGLTTLVDVLTLGALDLTEISVNINLTPGQLTIPVANQSPTPLVFTYPGTPSSPYTLSAGTDQLLSPTVQSALNSGLSVQLTANGGLLKLLGDVTTPILNVVLGPLLSALGSTLVPMLLQPVDSLLTSVTGLLGLSLGNAYVTNTPDSIKCGNPMLVQ
ncbi:MULTISPECIES: pilus assembly protein TadG-related protein [Burkholderia]|uniref:pilus assembly protein TadG-related protein n=1 Tax=Burkholderia TaxID=32008 RepID=UPI001CF520D2|nr:MULTISPECIES: pilus assembly protein TadG-related protein [Burkholderia]MCA8146730.1 pilus assembly protein TadG-related protein [Burkholderia vietnamiensis]MCA8291082.1 pilus assembly protein TadG-related protein [Burkholderia vietnamiensis]MCA8394636.1 pilus assembly protein TadG-related protein [Burkholderia vietnamiensis]MDN8076849.1 pilus assembly protein TadG-related protein [Burkholderia vietnamiensis]